MNINKHNYEAFFLDYHEGNLTPQQVAELLLFVEQHPELREEFESFENFSLEDFSVYDFGDKASLKKEINASNKEEYFVRYVDGTLSATESGLLQTFLKQHPQYSIEFEFFCKTKLVPDTSLVFANKAQLKRVPETADHLLISAVEGLLTKEENVLFKQQLSVDAAMHKEYSLYLQTKVQADTSVVFENKEELKRSKGKTIPFFYYISGVAAAIFVLFGLYIVFNNGNPEKQEIAKTVPLPELNPAKEVMPLLKENTAELASGTAASSVQKNRMVKNTTVTTKKDSLKAVPLIVEQPENIAQNIPSPEKQEITPEEQITPENNEMAPAANSNAVAKADDVNRASSKEFMSLGQIAATKIKEKTLDPDVLAMEKQTGRLKKISGWDVLQVVAKGVSKLTGKKVEARPTYNEEGEVTAFALGAGGFQFSRGK